jgi:hypothetical protein
MNMALSGPALAKGDGGRGPAWTWTANMQKIWQETIAKERAKKQP